MLNQTNLACVTFANPGYFISEIGAFEIMYTNRLLFRPVDFCWLWDTILYKARYTKSCRII